MTKQLVAGDLDPLTFLLTSGSMAEAIETALNAEVRPGVAEDPIGRRRLAAAIAQGVLNHLKANPGAFHVDVSDTGAAIQRDVVVEIAP